MEWSRHFYFHDMLRPSSKCMGVQAEGQGPLWGVHGQCAKLLKMLCSKHNLSAEGVQAATGARPSQLFCSDEVPTCPGWLKKMSKLQATMGQSPTTSIVLCMPW